MYFPSCGFVCFDSWVYISCVSPPTSVTVINNGREKYSRKERGMETGVERELLQRWEMRRDKEKY